VDGKSTERILVFSKGPLEGLIRFNFADMDAWFEEDMRIYVHPKDPYKRVDVLPSSRHIIVKIEGQTIAETHAPYHLFETGLPTRYYLPATSAAFGLLTPSNTVTGCPYKGEANYFNVSVGNKVFKDIVWYYRNPTPECTAIAGKICFYNEKVDIFIDGKQEKRPKTHFG
jgi:uncharacterized protein (DUF427 family)